MTYYRPKEVSRACELLAQTGGRVIAGGTDLVVRMERGFVSCEHFIDITHLPVKEVTLDGDRLTVGSGVNMATLAGHPLITEHAPLVALAARDVAAPQIRNRATIGGNIVNASPAADGVCGIAAYDPIFEVAGPHGTREVPFAQFFKAPGKTALGEHEILTRVHLDLAKPDGCVRELSHWFKHGNRLAQVISVVAFSARTFLDADNRVISARYAVASVAPVPFRVSAAEGLIAGRLLDDETIALVAAEVGRSVTPIDDLRASAAYRRNIAAIFARRHLTDFADGRGEGVKSAAPVAAMPIARAAESGPATFTLNGEVVQYDADQGVRLLDMLRDHFGLMGTKNGCGEGECGACTVILDGEPVNACMVLAGNVEGRNVLTIEGITSADGTPGLIQQAFVDAGAVQCGFCIPGMEMSAHHHVVHNDTADRRSIQEALSGNLCRCTGYVKIIEAVELAMARKGEENT